MTPEAREILETMLTDCGDDFFMLANEHANEGICLKCGNIQAHVEPDAEGYHCDDCDEPEVMGIEFALLSL